MAASWAGRVSKSMVMSARRCPKKLWLEQHRGELAQDQSSEFLRALGARVSEHAVRQYSRDGGRVLDLTPVFDPDEAVALTSDALVGDDVDTIFEAAFETGDLLVRLDVLKRDAEGAWSMVEVKSSQDVKSEHYADLSVQKFAVDAAGAIKVSEATLAHLDKEFVFDGVSLDGLLREVSMTEGLKGSPVDVRKLVQDAKALARPDAECPDTPIGPQCTQPYPCPFKKHCHVIPAEVPISILPYVGRMLQERWKPRGIVDLRDLPESALAKPMHRRMWRCHRASKAFISNRVGPMLAALPWPRYFMDFEMVQQGVPVVPGTTPRGALAFQWSLHKWSDPEERPGLEDARSFLQFTGADIRLRFLESLLDELGEAGPVFVHSIGTERSVLQALARSPECAHLRARTDAVVRRMVDTLQVAKEHYYSPAMMGSFGLKRIIETVPTTVDYSEGGAEVQNGVDAQLAWFRATEAGTTPSQRDAISRGLVEYCSRDTLAMVDLVRFLQFAEPADDEGDLRQARRRRRPRKKTR